MFKIAICDDDKNYIENICTLLATTHTPCEIYTFSSGRELVESELLFDFELIFLDIVMSDMDGIETLSHLSMTTTYIIFISTTSDRLRELYGRNVLGFLDKPIDSTEFYHKFRDFLQIVEQKSRFSFKRLGLMQSILADHILYFENVGHYIHLYTTTEKITFKEKISVIWERLKDNPSFAMPNRSFIVNLKYSSLSCKSSLFLTFQEQTTTISIGRTRKEDTHNRLLKFASEN